MINNSVDNSIVLDCPICFEEYSVKKRKPVVLDCGHSICKDCVVSILSSRIRKCPFDNTDLKRSAKDYPVNWSYIDIISSKYFSCV